MILHSLFYIILTNNAFSDTLLLPLKEGKLKTVSSQSDIFHPSLEVVIYPTSYFEVASCSSGEVININRAYENRFSIMIKTDSLFFTYILDTVNVKKGDPIEKAQIIGKLRMPVLETMSQERVPLIFIASKMKKLVSANRYLVFDKEKRI